MTADELARENSDLRASLRLSAAEQDRLRERVIYYRRQLELLGWQDPAEPFIETAADFQKKADAERAAES